LAIGGSLYDRDVPPTVQAAGAPGWRGCVNQSPYSPRGNKAVRKEV
jgi:hypothetical protein